MYIAKWYCLDLAVLDPNSKYTEQDYYDFDHKCTTIISQDSSNKFLNKSINVTEKDFPILKELLNNLKRFNLLKHNH